jgi:hypothetical protein
LGRKQASLLEAEVLLRWWGREIRCEGTRPREEGA